jgi:hypothetical protein
MNPTKQEKNKALVLEAFDTLFNKRDYVAAARYWSPDYIQHSGVDETRQVVAPPHVLRAAFSEHDLTYSAARAGNDEPTL